MIFLEDYKGPDMLRAYEGRILVHLSSPQEKGLFGCYRHVGTIKTHGSEVFIEPRKGSHGSRIDLNALSLKEGDGLGIV